MNKSTGLKHADGMPKPKPGTGAKPQIVPPERYPSGDRKPQAEAKTWSPTLIQRLKEHGEMALGDKRLGTQLGIMHLQGLVSETEFAANFAEASRLTRMHGAVSAKPVKQS